MNYFLEVPTSLHSLYNELQMSNSGYSYCADLKLEQSNLSSTEQSGAGAESGFTLSERTSIPPEKMQY